ncbi:MAG: NAD(P)H-quinone oxidoreductase subunit 5 [Pirellulaceae bacterium]|jgi:NAD(P)H-quinone oxidoreductase subunit 5
MELFAVALALPILCLLALACVPSYFANLHQKLLRLIVTSIVGLEFLIALLFAVAQGTSGATARSVSLLHWIVEPSVNFGIYYDSATSLMLLLVSFVGCVVSRFSIRYLDGEATQGRYFQWLGFTIGAVSLMVVAGNLMLFFVAWVMTSFGLHFLLLHYRQRPAAHRAAWTKFAISRLGDAFLIAALVVTFKTFGTFELSELFARAGEVGTASQSKAAHVAIGWLLMLGAVTKSAQFPFHTWLPDTMETPTPVSALMHAGVVNAGGYLVIRMSPLVALAPSALVTLAVIGAVTACFAGIVMMTQSSVKRALAYSTIAQMGFMMLQCGLGAFSAAMLHILAHSLYKAHAFLSSGSVVSQSLATRGAKVPTASSRATFAYLLAATAATVLTYLSIAHLFGVDIAAKPGGVVMAFILLLALTTWGWRLFTLESSRAAVVGLVGVAGLCLAYVGSYLAVDYCLSTSTPVVQFPLAARLVFFSIALAFFVLFALHTVLLRPVQPAWLAPLRVHAANGFYIDAIYHRISRIVG